MRRKSRAQSTAEYAIILAVVVGAAIAMQTYVKRGIQARQKAGTDAFTGINATFAAVAASGTDATFAALDQYEPYYLESSYERFQENVEQEHMGGGNVVKEKVADISATNAGGYQMQAVANGTRDTRDANWK
ncbi:hypothetical protein EPN16_03255 [bacterium]|nr:MAG: hypothetical protein EPN16_03255 [bacterium]